MVQLARGKRLLAVLLLNLVLGLVYLCGQSPVSIDPSPTPSSPNVADTTKAKADGLFDEAFKLVDEGTPVSIQSAESKFLEARRLYSNMGDRRSEAYTINEIVYVLIQMDRHEEALRFANDALPTFEELNEPKGSAVLLNHIGGIWSRRGRLLKALGYYERSLPFRDKAGDVRGKGTTVNNIGSIYFGIGQYQKALEKFTEALDLRERGQDAFGVAETISNLGAVNFYLGENAKALKFYNYALVIQKEYGDVRGMAVSLNNIGSIYSDMGEFETALTWYKKALPLRQESGDRGGQATTLLNIGQVSSAIGKDEEAWNNFQSALSIMKEIGDPIGEAAVLGHIGNQYLAKREFDKAFESFHQGLALVREGGDMLGQARSLHTLMEVSEFTQKRNLAIVYGKQAVTAYQVLRSNIRGLNKELQSSFLRKAEDTYRFLIELLVKEKRIPEAEQILRMLKDEEYFQFVSRDVSVSDSLNERSTFHANEKAAMERLEQRLKETLLRTNGKSGERSPSHPAQATVFDGVKLSAEIESMLSAAPDANAIGSQEPEGSSGGSQKILKEWKDTDTAFVSTIVGQDALTLIVTTVKFQRGYVIPLKEIRLKELVGTFRSSIMSQRFEDSDPLPAGQELYNVLIKPIEKDLKFAKVRTLVWSLDKFLRYVPVAALWDQKQGFLVQSYASVTLALASRQDLGFRPVNKGRWEALGAGTSRGIGSLLPLEHVPQEINSIVRDPGTRKGLIAGRQMLNEQFTYEKFRAALGKYAFTHAATHFVFLPGTKAEGLNSYLLLGDGGKLTLQQVQNSENMFVGIELLTLSACDTGYGGKTADGREIEGLGVLAQRKGARAIMATLWPVDDESTRDLMIDFYRGYQKPNVSKAEALRLAQLGLLGEPDLAAGGPRSKRGRPGPFAHPYFWSPFILIGNWR